MEVISHVNISVSGFSFRKIISLSIRHAPNEHGVAEIVGEIAADKAQDITKRTDEKTLVSVTTTADGQPTRLFTGYVENLTMQQGNKYSRVTLRLSAGSRRMDTRKENKSCQNTGKTYSDVISEAIAKDGDLHMEVSDKAIGEMVMRYNETGWEFAKRMASRLNAPLVADIFSDRPQVYVGMPPAARKVTIKSASYSYGSEVGQYSQTNGAMPEDFAGEWVESDQYAYVGDKIALNGKEAFIKSVNAGLKDGILHIRYALLTAAGGSAPMAGIAAPKVNNQASGKMVKGTVKAVEGDKVQVHLLGIDEKYDDGGNWWFPFSTAYSSSDGSGWYCMPEVGDEVRIFFPSGNEGEAFAASSVCADPPKNPRHKSWKAPGGKEILLTDEGMYIIGKSGKIYINLTDEKGVEIHSDKNIAISSDAKINISSANEIHVVATNQITIGTEEAYLDITKGTATLAGEEVLIN